MSNGEEYSQYSIHQAAKEFIKSNASQPFFAYLPYTPPHGLFDIPDSDPAWAIYKDKSWPEQAKKYAAMVTMLDRQVGEILDLLSELKIDEQTLVIFSGDNGGADYFSSKDLPRGFHGANVHPTTGVEFRGKKGNLYEGGLRIPFVARWPGKILPGGITDHLGYFPDVFPTFAELASIEIPEDIDGISFAPTLLGENGRAMLRALMRFSIGKSAIGSLSARTIGEQLKAPGMRTGNSMIYPSIRAKAKISPIRIRTNSPF